MAVATQTMTDEQRKSVALEYLKAFDNGGVTSTGGSILDLFAGDAQVYFPKWGLANGKEEVGRMFSDVGSTLKSSTHDYSTVNWIFSGGDVIVCEGTSHGEHQDGPWRAGVPEWGAEPGPDAAACRPAGPGRAGCPAAAPCGHRTPPSCAARPAPPRRARRPWRPAGSAGG